MRSFVTILLIVAGLMCAALFCWTFSREVSRPPRLGVPAETTFPRVVPITGLAPGRNQGPSPELGDDLIYYCVEVARAWVDEGIADGVLETYNGQPVTGTQTLPESQVELWEYNLTKKAERCVGRFAVRELNKVIMSRDGRYLIFDGPVWHRPDIGLLYREGYRDVFNRGAILQTGVGGRAEFLRYDDWSKEIKWAYAVYSSVPDTGQHLTEEKLYEATVSTTDTPRLQVCPLTLGFYPSVGLSREYFYGLYREKDGHCLYRRQREGKSCDKLITVPLSRGFTTRDVIPLDGERRCVIASSSALKDSSVPRAIYILPLDKTGSLFRGDKVYFDIPAGWELTTIQPPVSKGLVLSKVGAVRDGGRVRVKFALLDLGTLELTPLFDTDKDAVTNAEVKAVAWLKCGDESYALPSSKYVNRVDGRFHPAFNFGPPSQ